MDLKKKVGPLPTWAWIALVGGGAGVYLLWKKSKEAKSTEEGSLPIPSSFTANPPEGSASGAGGGPGEVKSSGEGPSNNASEPSSITGSPVSDFLATEKALHEGGWEREAEFAVAHPVGSAAPAVSAALKTAKGGTVGRGGATFKAGTYKGHAAHIYTRAVKGGVGPGKNVIVLAPSHGSSKTAHSKTPSHAPAHVTGSTTHHAAAPKKAPVKHAAAPKKPKAKKR
jgi:hypothetical protein